MYRNRNNKEKRTLEFCMLFSLNDELRSDVVIDNFAQNREIVQDIQEPHENQWYSVTSFMSNHGTVQPSVAEKKKKKT